MCSAKHFFFECEKFKNVGNNRSTVRAAFGTTQQDEPWDEFTTADANDDEEDDEDEANCNGVRGKPKVLERYRVQDTEILGAKIASTTITSGGFIT
jgi:hypothetical protein